MGFIYTWEQIRAERSFVQEKYLCSLPSTELCTMASIRVHAARHCNLDESVAALSLSDVSCVVT